MAEEKKYKPVDVTNVDFKKLGRPLSKLIQGLKDDDLLAESHDHYRDKPEHDHYRDNGHEWERG